MYPVVATLQVAGVERTIGSYGLCLTLAFVLALVMMARAAARRGLDLGATLAATALTAAGAVVGGWLLFGLVEWLRGAELLQALSLGGRVLFGGLFGGALVLVLACRWLGLPFGRVADTAVPALAACVAVGRLGCFVGGCCYGSSWDGPWSIVYTDALAPGAHPPVPRHPAPLYEAAVALVLGLFAVRWSALRPGRDGDRMLRYLTCYALARVGLEVFRGDVVRGHVLGGFVSTSQLIALPLALGGLWLLRSRRPQRLGSLLVGLLALSGLGQGYARLSVSPHAVVAIEAGWLSQGSSPEDLTYALELCRSSGAAGAACRPGVLAREQPQRRVFVSRFALDRTEVSNEAYQRCVAANACPPAQLALAGSRYYLPERPVTGVTWPQAARYCAFVGGRLPTEAEWERAARGDDGRRFPWGSRYQSALCNHGRGPWPDGRRRADPSDGHLYGAPVQAYPAAASPFGVLNLAGNALEWTQDRYSATAYASARRIDPAGAPDGSTRVVRGGSWLSQPVELRTTHRRGVKQHAAWPDLGFRCAYDVARSRSRHAGSG